MSNLNTVVDNVKRGFNSLGKLEVPVIFATVISAVLVIDGTVALFAGDFKATLLVGLAALAGIGYTLYRKGSPV